MGGIYVSESKTWNKLHTFKDGDISSCSSLSVYDEDIVTGGENGSLNLLTVNHEKIRTIGNNIIITV